MEFFSNLVFDLVYGLVVLLKSEVQNQYQYHFVLGSFRGSDALF